MNTALLFTNMTLTGSSHNVRTESQVSGHSAVNAWLMSGYCNKCNVAQYIAT